MTTGKREILYPYARVAGGDVVHIAQLEDVHGELSCVACGNAMIAKRGDVVRHHFAHEGAVCPLGETALHWCTKYMIRDSFNWAVQNGQPYEVEWACYVCRLVRTVDLAALYNTAVVEGEPFLGVRSDVLLTSDDGRVLGIEGVVSNALTEEKAGLYQAKQVPYILITLRRDDDIDGLRDGIRKPYDVDVSKWGWGECSECRAKKEKDEADKRAKEESITAQDARIVILRRKEAAVTDTEEAFHANLPPAERKAYRESITERWQQLKDESAANRPERDIGDFRTLYEIRQDRRQADIAKWNAVIRQHVSNGAHERAERVRWIMKNILFLTD